MPHDALHHPLAKPAPVISVQHEYIAQISKRRKIADHTSKPNLRSPKRSGCPSQARSWLEWGFSRHIMINPKAQRMLDRSGNDLPRNSLCPIASGQKPMNQIQILTRRISTDQKLPKPGLED